MHVCHVHTAVTAHPEPELKLNGTSIPFVVETNFLGLIFDRKIELCIAYQILEG
jgi:hypothetical protein